MGSCDELEHRPYIESSSKLKWDKLGDRSEFLLVPNLDRPDFWLCSHSPSHPLAHQTSVEEANDLVQGQYGFLPDFSTTPKPFRQHVSFEPPHDP